MKFLQNLSQFGDLIDKPTGPSRSNDPIQRARENFINHAKRQRAVLHLPAQHKKGSWYQRQPDGSFIICLRSGTNCIKLHGDRTHIVISDITKVDMLLSDAIDACMQGELDDALQAATSSRKARISA